MKFVQDPSPTERAERLDAIYGNRFPLVANFVNGAILVGLLWDEADRNLTFSWLAVLWGLVAIRWYTYRLYRTYKPVRDLDRWFAIHAIGSTLTGLAWGASTALVLISDSSAVHMLVGLTTIGMTAGSLATSFASPFSFRGFALGCLAPTAVFFAIHGGAPYLAVTALTIVYFIIMSLTARGLADAVFHSFRLEARLRDSIESLSDAFIVYDQVGRVLTWNNRMVAMFPYLTDKIAAGMRLAELLELAAAWPAHNIPPEGRAAWIAGNLAAIGKGTSNDPVVIDLADGRTYDARERRTAEGGWVSVFRDITEQRQAEAEMRRARAAAEEANRAKSQFLANMSHEIRTPLAGVISVLDILVEDGLTPGQKQKTEMARRSADQLMEVIGDILDMSKLEAAAIKLESVAVDLATVVDDAVKIVGARAFAKNLEIRSTLDPRLARRYLTDPTRLRQVLINLMGNAVKFTEKGGVFVSLSRIDDPNGDLVEFKVIDTGIGIPADQLPLLFKKFSQADQSISRRFGGTGLGLAIAQEFVTMMGGRIEITSEPGRGSTFHFTLRLTPALGATASAAESVTAPLAPLPLRGRRVLLVEDDPTNRFAGSELLLKCGAAVETAEDGEVGVAKAMAAPFDLILMDMQMPRLDGLAAARRLRAAPGPNRSTPILALTANAFTDDIEQCLAAGMTAHLVKPLRRRVVETELVRYLPAPEAVAIKPASAASDRQCSPDSLAALEADLSRDGVLSVVAAFASGRNARIQELRAACEKGDVAAVRMQAHSLKAVARLFGAERLEVLAASLENDPAAIAAQDGRAAIDEIRLLVDALAAELNVRYVAAA